MQNAKITKEIQTNRVKEGTSTEFNAGFAGNPQPEVPVLPIFYPVEWVPESGKMLIKIIIKKRPW